MALLADLRQAERIGARISSLDLDSEKPVLTVEWQLDEISFEHGCEAREDGTWSCGKRRGASCPRSRSRFKNPYGFEYQHLVGRLCLIRPKSANTR